MFKKPFIDLQSFENEIYQKNNLLIKPLKIKDIKKRYIQSLKDKEINQYLISKKKKKLNKNHIYKYVSENNLSSSSILFGIFFKKKHIGNCRIHFVKNELFIGIAIFDKLKQRKGFGSKILKIVPNFAFKNLNVNHIQAKIHNKNQNSINAFIKAGFKIKYKKYTHCFVIKKK